MPTFTAPPGHCSQPLILAVANIAKVAINFAAPDPDLKTPVLTLPDNQKFTTSNAIARHVAALESPPTLYPSDPTEAGKIDSWMLVASSIESASCYWVDPFANGEGSTDTVREQAKQSIETALEEAEKQLLDTTYLAGGNATLADLTMACSMLPLLQTVLSKEARDAYPATMKWFGTTMNHPALAKVVGEVVLCPEASGWVVPVAAAAAGKKDKKKKKGKGEKEGDENTAPDADTADGAAGPSEPKEEDPEKVAKKAAAKAEKEAKKAKAEAKAKAAAEKAAAPAAAADDKKAKAKPGQDKDAKKQAEEEELSALLAAAAAVAKGDKKDVSGAMPKAYYPKVVESRWYEWWQQCGYFKPDVKSTKPPFVMVIPPPNVTGALHIGHALMLAVEDTIVRWRRMSGYNTLWVPGTDHAGIATQTVVEKKLAREKHVTRHDLGREAFLSEVYTWVDEYGGKILEQLKRMGSSVDWDHKVFTMDAPRSKAVLEAFVRMHTSGIIYRDNRLVNWDCRLKTAVSDIEVDYIDVPKRTLMSVPGFDDLVEFGVLTSFAYPLADGEGEIVVATTRPETMLGDTAVAIHPDDARYTHLHGKFVVHPVHGTQIPIICDGELVDMAFGTGAVKITPAHDPNDFKTGKRHDLAFITVIDDNGLINENGGELFQGQHRFKARTTVVDFLREKGLFRGKADNTMRLGVSSRSKDVIEPLLKPQWWVNCSDMAARSCQAVRDGQLNIIPKDFEVIWFRWLENIRDWCISRQLWWGHRIPAYYIIFEGETPEQSGLPGRLSENIERWVVGRDESEATKLVQERYPGKTFSLVQDEDVLDTWFSSGLFPFSVFNWPDQTEDLAVFYPTALLETGHDILFFWVARMVMMALQLTDQVPFKDVFLHAMVRDAHGRKMSKTLGNVVDPLHVIEGMTLQGLHDTLTGGNLDAKEVDRAREGQKQDFPDGIEECGTDALRFALVAYTSQARDINLDVKRVVAYRHWCNKLWNATKFAMMNLPEGFVPAAELQLDSFPAPARWILSRLSRTIAAVVDAMHKYDFSIATQRVYAFWQYDLCDVFIELMKPIITAGSTGDAAAATAAEWTRQALWVCLDSGLRLLHPFMPYVTEELWQRLPKRQDKECPPSIMVADYPEPCPAWEVSQLESDMEYVQGVVNRMRGLRSDYGLTKERPEAFIACTDPAKAAMLGSMTLEIATLTTSTAVSMLAPGSGAPAGCGVAVVDDTTVLHLLLRGILKPEQELQKLDKKLVAAEQRVEQLRKKMATQTYQDKTPENIKVEEAEKLVKMEAEISNIVQAIVDMKQLLGSQ